MNLSKDEMQGESSRTVILFYALEVLGILWVLYFLWARTIGVSGFWLDETITGWITGSTLGAAFERAWHYQGQSPIYFGFIAALRGFVSLDETKLRLLSLIALFATLTLVYKLGSQFGDRVAGVLAVNFVLSWPWIPQLLYARPYAIGLFALTASVYYLIRYCKSQEKIDLGFYWISTLVSISCQYLFAAVLFVHALVWLRNRGGSLKAIEWLVLASFLSLGCAGGIQLYGLMSDGRTLAFGEVPTFSALFNCYLSTPTRFAVGAILLIIAFSWLRGLRRQIDWNWLTTCIVWSLLAPLSLFLLSHLLERSLYVARYLIWFLPGYALLLSYAIFVWIKPRWARQAITLALLAPTSYSAYERQWTFEDWRLARDTVACLRGPTKSPVFLYSGLAELQNGLWMSDRVHSEYLSAPFKYYPLDALVIPVPANFGSKTLAQYFKEEILPKATEAGSFILAVSDAFVPPSSNGVGVAAHYETIFQRFGFEKGRSIRQGLISVTEFIGKDASMPQLSSGEKCANL